MPFIIVIFAVAFVVAGVATPLSGAMRSGKAGAGFSIFFIIAFGGALLGAFAAFGDAPFLLAHSWLQPQVTAGIGAVLSVGIYLGTSSFFGRKRSGPRAHEDKREDQHIPPPVVPR